MKNITELIQESDAIMIGAGAGLSTSAGFTYSGERFEKYFFDFIVKYGFQDMYEGGFYTFSSKEEYWAYWSRYIYINRYMNVPKNTYQKLFHLIKEKDYFVLTTNVDHCFQKAGFDKNRLFYTQGDYGLFQCSDPCHKETYDNEEMIQKMLLAQGFQIDSGGDLYIPDGVNIKMYIPNELIPICPKCGKPMTMNLRADDTFVENEGWHRACQNYLDFAKKHEHTKVLYLELGVGYNTPSIIKFNFWNLTKKNPHATYLTINPSDSYIPQEIKKQSYSIQEDIDKVL